jgi:hypothetical protein
MDPSVDRDSEHEARDCTKATISSPFMAVPAVEPETMDYEEWRGQVRSLCGIYTPKGVDRKTFAGSIRPASVWGAWQWLPVATSIASSGQVAMLALMAWNTTTQCFILPVGGR